MDPEAGEADALLLALHDGRDDAEPLAGAVDYRGLPVSRKRHGRWLSANFVIGTEVAERFAFYGVSSNLISYLTGPLGESTASAAAVVNVWEGASQMLPLLGSCVADSCLGRYRTILLASALYILGLGMVTISAVLPPDHAMKVCADAGAAARCRPSGSHMLAFYASIYMVAFAQGCHKPCVQAFGADQFDRSDAEESAARSSFFNWLRFWMSWGDTVAVVVLSYVQDNVGWGLGFGIPWVVVCLSMAIFLLGTRTYRMYPPEKDNPFARIGNTFVAMSKNWLIGFLPRDRKPAKMIAECEMAVHVEEAKGILRLFPIWVTSLIYAIVLAQVGTLFTKQASTLDRRLGKVLDVPAAALQSFGGVTIIAFIPVYDRAIVPLARRLTGLPSGVTMLQRIGAGIAVGAVTMAAAAVVEGRRLTVAREHGVADDPDAAVPMGLWWIVPQYVLIGVADVLTIVGLQEFFYDQVPDSLRSLGLALYLSILGIGSFLSGLLVSVIDGVTRRAGGGEGWFPDNLNRAHLDYFYWLLAALSTVELVAFLHYAGKYVCKKKDNEPSQLVDRS